MSLTSLAILHLPGHSRGTVGRFAFPWLCGARSSRLCAAGQGCNLNVRVGGRVNAWRMRFGRSPRPSTRASSLPSETCFSSRNRSRSRIRRYGSAARAQQRAAAPAVSVMAGTRRSAIRRNRSTRRLPLPPRSPMRAATLRPGRDPMTLDVSLFAPGYSLGGTAEGSGWATDHIHRLSGRNRRRCPRLRRCRRQSHRHWLGEQ
jgi:hypothetical protein